MTTRFFRIGAIAVLSVVLSVGRPLPAQDEEASEVTGARLEAVAAHVRAGEDERAIALLLPEAELPADARYLLGRLRERAGDLASALGTFVAVPAAAVPEGVRDDLDLRVGRLMLATGDTAGAEARLTRMAHPTRISRALLAECAVARGELDVAERRLRASIREERSDTDGFALRMLLAQVLAARDHRDEALETLVRLVVDRPEHPDDASAWAAARTIAGEDLVLSADDQLIRIAHLSERHHHARALEASAALTMPERGTARAEALHVVGMAHYRARHDDEAHTLLSEAARLGGAHETEDAFHAARALHRPHPDMPAVRALRAFARAYPGHRLAVEAEYLAAMTELDLEPGRGRRSAARFVASHPGGDYGREAQFRLAMDAFDRRRWDDASERLTALGGATDELEQRRIRYWQARVMEEDERWPAARAAYRGLIEAGPLHYYALLSRQRLIARGEVDPPPFGDAAGAPVPEVHIAWPEAATFYRTLGLDRDAARVLRSSERALRAAHGLRAMAEAYLEVSGFERAYRMTAESELLDGPITEDTAWAWRAAYPRAFDDEVRAAATESAIEPELLWAVMRQESAYAPGVVSVSDAIGLMQLLPSTASRMAGELGVPFRRELLFSPRDNVRFGAHYLAQLASLVSVPVAFAAYNAGEHRIAQWWAAPACRGEWPLDRFIDWIPYAQTRGYVRRVTSHWLRYRYLTDPSRGWPEIVLPATAGDGRACARPD